MDGYEELLQALTVERFSATRSRRPAGTSGTPDGAEAPAAPKEPREAANRLLLRVEEVAELLDVGRTRVYELIRSGALKSVKIGGSRRIPVAAVEAYIQELLRPPR